MVVGEKLEMQRSIIYMSIIVGAVMISPGLVAGTVREGYMSKIVSLANIAIMPYNFKPLFALAYMSEYGLSPIQRSTVGFELGTVFVDQTPDLPGSGDEFYANVVDKCVFHSNESFEPLCVICRLSDADGNVVAAGIKGEDFDEAYIGSTTAHIDVKPDPENFLSNEVTNFQNVELQVCAPLEEENSLILNPLQEVP